MAHRLSLEVDCTAVQCCELFLVAGADRRKACFRQDRTLMYQVWQAHSRDDIDVVRSMLREYQEQLGIDLGFQGFEAELASLPGTYAPPTGRLLLASHDGMPRGCVALQAVSASRGEMKRLYVRPNARGLGIGRLLVARVLAEARAIGYDEVVLDTLPTMTEAQRLYEQFGFVEIEPYRPNPIAGTKYLCKKL